VLFSGIVLLLLGAATRPPGLGDVQDLRVFKHPGYTRVVVELSRKATYEAHVLPSPPRLYLDIDGVWLGELFREARTLGAPGPVRRIRGGQNTLHRARVVVELDRVGRQHRTFHLQDPFRIVTDIFGEGGPVPTSVRPFDSRPVHRIVIDPGHGGKDPGALGPKRLMEKNVVLQVAETLRARLRAEGFEVFLTRKDDRYLTLEQRTEIANRLRADLFVSIHANAARNRKSHGVETYLLDTRYDRQTARVAARENGTTVEALDDLQKILASLRLGYNERFAARVAYHLQRSLVKRLKQTYRGTADLGVKRGPFLVLFAAAMPAALVEIGFLSNRAEANRMRTKKFTRAAADGIANGVLRYRDEHARRLLAEK
jgi:N-acetylmuramoyl-L-alanine amidase